MFRFGFSQHVSFTLPKKYSLPNREIVADPLRNNSRNINWSSRHFIASKRISHWLALYGTRNNVPAFVYMFLARDNYLSTLRFAPQFQSATDGEKTIFYHFLNYCTRGRPSGQLLLESSVHNNCSCIALQLTEKKQDIFPLDLIIISKLYISLLI